MRGRETRKARLLKAACLAAGLCAASWGSQAEAVQATPNYNIDISVQPTLQMNNFSAWFFYQTNTSSPWYPSTGMSLNQPIDAYNSGTGEGGTDIHISFYDSNNLEKYGIFGAYDTGSSAGVTIGMTNGQATSILGKSWENVFPDISETNVLSYINSGYTGDAMDYNNLISGYFSLASLGYLQSIGEPVTLVNFSNATNGGTATVSAAPVPIPATLLLFGSGLGILIARKRKGGNGR